MKRHRGYWLTLLGFVLFSLLLNLIAFSKGFCDWYAEHVHPLFAGYLGRLNGWFSVALGEILMDIGILLVLVAVVLAVLLLVFRKKAGMRRFARGYYKTMLMILAFLLCSYSVIWTVPLRGSLLGKNLPATGEYRLTYVLAIRNQMAEAVNEAALCVPRDDSGRILYPAMAETGAGVRQGIQKLAGEFPRLGGYSAPPKTALCSDVLHWMGIGGFTIPVTMEVLLNKYSQADRMFAPTLYAHELAHYHGFYKESEGDFIGSLACMKSDDPLVHYAGLVDVWWQLDEAFWMLADKNSEYELVDIAPIVWDDLRAASEEAAAVYADDSHPLEGFEGQFTDIAEIGWQTQAEILQEYNYDGSLALLLWYFST